MAEKWQVQYEEKLNQVANQVENLQKESFTRQLQQLQSEAKAREDRIATVEFEIQELNSELKQRFHSD